MIGHDRVYHPRLTEMEIVAVPQFLVAQQFQHLLLRERREQQPELLLVVAVGGAETGVELAVVHDGESVAQVATLFFQRVDGGSKLAAVQKTGTSFGERIGFPREIQLGRGFIAVNQQFAVAVDRYGFFHRGRQRLGARDPPALLLAVGVGVILLFFPADGERTGVGLRPPPLTQFLGDDPRIAVDGAALTAQYRTVVVGDIRPVKVFHQLLKPGFRNIAVDRHDGHGFHDDGGNGVPAVELV